ncbi:MAG: rhodanese-like domain-containing protein [Actinomycetota bacterium]|nr:rhodanese-like domain-containing protein [Actinomycetota bacterium]MDQ3642051.1 rhodanese-like domain-containing protein [Actinomycetota bacterium]
MPAVADRAQVRRLVDEEDAQLAEVLPREEYDDEHLREAIHLPLKKLNADTARALDWSRPVIVYCWDAL